MRIFTTKAERIFERYKVFMFNTSFKILQDSSLSDDAVQIAFERILKNLHKIDETNDKQTSSYIYVICVNASLTLYNQHLGKNSELEFEDKVVTNTTLNHSPDPADIVANKDNLERIMKAISSLKPIYKNVMLLKYCLEKENHEIASSLGIPEATVRKRLQRGRETLLETLKKEEVR